MKHILSYVLIVFAGLSLACAVWAQPLNSEQRKTTIDYINSLENPDGGFRPSAKEGPSGLGASSSAIRALKHLGTTVKHKDQVEKVILQFAQESGAFAEQPGKPEIRATWFGVNALVNIGSAPKNADGVRDYVTRNAKSLYPDIYFAAAALEDIKMKSPKASEWIAAFEATRNPDGSYGKGAADTAHAVVVILRLGGTVRDPGAVGKVLKAAQNPNGGFAGEGDAVNLPGTYTVMRALRMLKEKPDLASLYRYVASQRNPDGGYGVAPGKPSNMTFTYFASAILDWADKMAK